MILRKMEVLILGYEDLNKNLRKSLLEEKVDGGLIHFEVDVTDFTEHVKRRITEAELVVFVYGVNKQVLKARK